MRRRTGLGGGGGSSALPPSQGGPSSPSTLVDGVMSVRARGQELLAATHPENLPFLAELFTGCVLQVGCCASVAGRHYAARTS